MEKRHNDERGIRVRRHARRHEPRGRDCRQKGLTGTRQSRRKFLESAKPCQGGRSSSCQGQARGTVGGSVHCERASVISAASPGRLLVLALALLCTSCSEALPQRYPSRPPSSLTTVQAHEDQ